MADGNLGDLGFSLGIKDNVSKELDKILTKFVNMDVSVNKATDSIRKLSTKLREAKDPADGETSKEFVKLANAVDGAATRIVHLRNEIRKTSDAINEIKAIPNFMKDANLVSSLNKLQGYLRTLGSIDGSKLIDGNRIQAIFSNGARSIQEANAALKQYKETANQAKSAVEANARAARDLASAFRQANDAASGTSRVAGDLKNLLLQGGLVYGAQQFAMSIIQTGGEIEKQHIALQSIIGDLQNANELFGQIKNLALASPFTFSELNRDVKQLAAFGVETENLYDKTKRIADISAGLGVSFERLGLAYGQVKARSWLDGKELRQFAYAGLPMLQKLAEMYTRERGRSFTTRDVREMITKREVSFEDVDKIFDELTDKGGQFYQMQNTLSETLLGRYLKLKDAWEIMLSGFAQGDNIIGGTFKHIINSVTVLIQSLDKLAPVVLAAFSGFALHKVGVSLGGGVASRILSSKSNLAARYQEKALTEQLSATEQRILATKRQITSEDVRTLAASGAITKAELERLLVTGKITAAQYRQIVSLDATVGKINAATVRLRAMNIAVANGGGSAWQQFAVKGMAAVNIVGARIKSIGATLWTAIGGLPGLIITGVTMGLTYLWQQSEELKQAQKQALDELSDRGKRLGEFLADNDISNAIAKGGQEIENSIESYKDKLKELAPYNYDAYMMNANEKDSHEERLKYLRQELDLLMKANAISQAKSDAFIDKYKSTFGLLSEFSSKYRELKDNGGFASGIRMSGANQNFDRFIKGLAEDLAKDFPNVAKDPKMRESMKMLRQNIYSQLAIKPEDQFKISVRLDELLGLDTSSNFTEVVENELREAVNNPKNKIILENGVTEYASTVAEKIKNGQKLTQAEEELLRKCYNIAIRQVKQQYPEFESILQGLLNSSKFYANIRLNFVGTKSSDMQGQVYRNFPAIDLSERNTKARNLAMSWVDADQSPYDAINKGRQEVDKRYNNLVSIRKMFKKGKATAEEVRVEKEKYDEAVYALSHGYGDDYKGQDRRSNKIPKNTGAESAFNKRQREILKGWQERKKVLEEYYETWNKWRDVVGKERAKGIVRSDKRFAPVSKDFTDPEILGTNLDRLANKYAKLAKTEEQRHFITETRAQAARKEADLELEGAEKSMRALTEKLDLLSKQYDLYQKLAKVMGGDTAAHYAFGSNHLGLAGNWSYYGYLKDYLNRLDGKSNIKPFVNGNPNDKTPTATVYAKAVKGVDFDKYGGLKRVLEMSDTDINDTFGGKGNLSKLLVDFKKEINKLDDKIADSLIAGYEYFEDYKAQVDGINKSYDEQIERLKERNQLNKDNSKYISDEELRKGTVVLNQQRNKEINNVNLEAQKHSKDYYNFFGAITALKVEDAEKYGNTIRDLVNKAFQSGAINAREYSKQIKQIDEQMEKMHSQHSDFLTYIQGGFDAVIQKYKTNGDDMQARGAFDYGSAKEKYSAAEVNGDINSMAKYYNDMRLAQNMQSNGKAMSDMASKMKGTVAVIDAIVNGINNTVQSMKKFVDQLADDFDTLGKGGNGIRDSKGYQFVSGFSEASQGAADGWNNLKNGNIMGAVTGVYRSFAGWFTGTARARDAKLERQIQLSERQLKALNNLQNSIERNLKNTLGGVYSYKAEKGDIDKLKAGLDDYSLAKNGVKYGHDTRLASKAIGAGAGFAVGAGSAALSGAMLGSAVGPIGAAVGAVAGAIIGTVIGGLFGHKKRKHTTVYREKTNAAMEKAYRTQAYYDQQFAVMNMQLDQTNAKLEKEKEKKKKDESKIDDYESQVAELNSQIKTFALDMAKSIYDIDLKSWAKELTNAIVEAWSKGEDAAKAYHDKVKDLMKNLALNIVAKRIMEASLKDVSEFIAKEMNSKSGLLDATAILKLADLFEKAGGTAVKNLTNFYEALKSKGYDLSQNGSSSIGNGIKSITEQTADILASYINAIRLDVSVDRVNIQKIADALATMPEMNSIANSQLETLKVISANTQRNAENTERILAMFREITTPGLKKVNIH